jgi:hypothetical protein
MIAVVLDLPVRDLERALDAELLFQLDQLTERGGRFPEGALHAVRGHSLHRSGEALYEPLGMGGQLALQLGG